MVLGMDERGDKFGLIGEVCADASSAMPVSCHCSFQVYSKRSLISRPNIRVMELADKVEDFEEVLKEKTAISENESCDLERNQLNL